ncbi:hypothetical protein NQ318_016365, partial [Aromia moschata]
ILSSSESEVIKPLTIEEKIFQELNKLPIQYKGKPLGEDKSIDLFLDSIKKSKTQEGINLLKLWKEANSGGNQQVVFKPKWYSKYEVIEGPVYAGKDRYGSEIVGFYLSLILKRYLTPISVERKLSLKQDIVPAATKRLLDTIFERNNKTCVYGKCYFCKKEDPVCEDQNLLLTGAVIFNINASLNSYRSPWQRTYKKGKKALWQEYPESYCKTVKQKLTKKRLHDLIDTSIFDFLIQNGDRHHYETFGDTVIWLDNGKGLGNPNIHHLDILAPLYQCCILRRQTWQLLRSLTGGKLRERLESMPDIGNIITEDHINAIEERLLIIFATVEYCTHKQEENYLAAT